MNISQQILITLAMDSYNRGYNSQIGTGRTNEDGLGSAAGTQIGNAQLIALEQLRIDEVKYQEWQDFGFYASAYEIDGKTVISYRGTDKGASIDIANGYGVGLGKPSGPQATLAIEFCLSVAARQKAVMA